MAKSQFPPFFFPYRLYILPMGRNALFPGTVIAPRKHSGLPRGKIYKQAMIFLFPVL